MKNTLIKLMFISIIMSFLLTSCVDKSQTGKSVISDESSSIVLKNGVLIDGAGALPEKNMTIIIQDDKIVKIIEDNKAKVPHKSQVIDLGGSTVMPGFINTHVHKAYNEDNLSNWLNDGVTTVRDESPAGTSDFISKRDEFNKNPKYSTIISATPIMSVNGGYGSLNFDSPEDAKIKVLDMIDKKVDIIKVSIEDSLQGRSWNMPTYDEIKSIVDTAHSKNKKVSVHITHSANLQWAIDAGVDDIAHMVVEPVDEDMLNQVIKKNIYWVPTLELWQGVSSMHSLDLDEIAIDNLSKFYKAGGKIALGTDFAGYTCEFDKGFPLTEITLMKEAGMSNMDIIQSATKNAAHVCDIEAKVGTVEEGKIADLFIVSGDPLSDINCLTKVKMVVHKGVIVRNEISR